MRTPLLSLAILLSLASAAPACPMCKDSVQDDAGKTNAVGPNAMDGGPAAGLPGGFNASVYLMLGGLFGTLGLVSWTIAKGIRGS